MVKKKKFIPHQDKGGGLFWAANAHGYQGVFGIIRFSYIRLKSWVFHYLAREIIPFSNLKVLLHRSRGVHIGKNVSFTEKIWIDEVYPEYVYIGDNVALAPYVKILAHQNPPSGFKEQLLSYVSPIKIKEGAWIGFGATILPGVTIGKYSIVGANSLVNKDVPDYSLVAGTPAKVIKLLNKNENS